MAAGGRCTGQFLRGSALTVALFQLFNRDSAVFIGYLLPSFPYSALCLGGGRIGSFGERQEFIGCCCHTVLMTAQKRRLRTNNRYVPVFIYRGNSRQNQQMGRDVEQVPSRGAPEHNAAGKGNPRICCVLDGCIYRISGLVHLAALAFHRSIRSDHRLSPVMSASPLSVSTHRSLSRCTSPRL